MCESVLASVEATEADQERPRRAGCTVEEYNRCEKCTSLWNRRSHRFGCIDRRCRGASNTDKPPSTPPIVDKKTCVQCRAQARLQKRGGQKAAATTTIATRKLTPLFWDSDVNMFSRVWSAEDPTLTKDGGWVLERRKSHQSLDSVD